MIDTHCHLTYPKLIERVDEVIAAANAAGVDRMITIGTTPRDVHAARDVAHAHVGVFFTAGVHPHYAAEVDADQLKVVAEASDDPRCVGYGEMGIDYHYPDPPRDVQHELFAAQLNLVKLVGDDRPIVIHCRKAVDDTLAMLRESGLPGERFVFHCFTEPADECRKVLDFGARVSFTGIVTYKNAPEVRESALLVPDHRIMVETDAPYLSPEPHRKVRPNEPKFVVDTARFLADLRSSTFDEFDRLTTANAERCFGV